MCACAKNLLDWEDLVYFSIPPHQFIGMTYKFALFCIPEWLIKGVWLLLVRSFRAVFLTPCPSLMVDQVECLRKNGVQAVVISSGNRDTIAKLLNQPSKVVVSSSAHPRSWRRCVVKKSHSYTLELPAGWLSFLPTSVYITGDLAEQRKYTFRGHRLMQGSESRGGKDVLCAQRWKNFAPAMPTLKPNPMYRLHPMLLKWS